MSDTSIWTGPLSSLADSGAGAVLVARWTLLLALAWLAHSALIGRNPRWRVALWRGAILGVGLVAALATLAPIVSYPIAPRADRAAERREEIEPQPPLEPAPSASIVPAASLARERREAVNPPARPTSGPEFAAIPGPAESWPARVVGLARSWALSIWLAGALLLTARLILAALALARLVGRSSDAPDDVARECRAIAEHLGCTRTVRVVCSAEVATPCLAGLFRPVMLLPDRVGHGRDDLRAILAHELAHARHHDVAWNLAAHLASIALWFHPLAWRIRSAHAAACDSVSDAVAADYLGDVMSYGRTLARLALGASSPSPAHVLAMARTSDVRRRLDALKRQVFRTPLSRRLIMPALLVGGVLLVLIGGFGFTRAEQATPPAARRTPGKLTLRAVAAATDRPIEGVSLEYRVRFGGENREGTVATGKDGLATIDYPPDAGIETFRITARKAGLVPICILWENQRHPVEVPPSKELRLEPGTTIGGIIKDEAGHPIAAARVEVHAPLTECEAPNHAFSLGTLQTDAQGRWKLDVAPKDLGGVWVNVEHPRHRRNDRMASRDLEGVIVLTRGLTVTGRVGDAEGRPVKGARAIIGHDIVGSNPPTATTDDRGEFTLENCDAGPSIVTVQAEGYAPRFRDVRVEARTAPVVITLPEPGATLRGRVLDIEGKPVAGALVGADAWRGHRSLEFLVKTGVDGRFEWRGAPRDVVLYGVFKEGYMSSRQLPLTASDREQVVTIYPELVITGRVTDSETGRPLPKFRVVQGCKYVYEGQTRTTWAENQAVDVAGGRYTTRFSEPCKEFFVRVEAPGYQPAESRAFRSTEGGQTFDFALQRGGGLSGVVLLPDGKPAAVAEVVLATEELGWLMQAGRFDRRANLPSTTTDADGRFTFNPKDDRFLLVAASDAGYADASPDEFAKSGKLVLRPWGKIEGEVRIGRQPGANQHVMYNPVLSQRGGRWYGLTYGYDAMTDARGRFTFDRVVPGRGTAWRVVSNPVERRGSMWGWHEPVEVKPGQTTRVQVGGKGRPVIGRVVLDGEPETPVDWTRNQPVVISDQRDGRQFSSYLDRDGGFRIDDVPPGRYLLQLPVNGAADARNHGQRDRIGMVRSDLNVIDTRPGQADQPLDLGTVTAGLFPTLRVGAPAPDFDVERIAGKGKGDRLKLVDERGKLVLIHFWIPETEPSLAELPALKEIQKTFGGDPRFRLISLACGRPAATALRVIRENGLIWTHGFAGAPGQGVTMSFKLQSIPATFLIGPDGRVLAKDLHGAALKEAITQALESEEDRKGRRK